MTAIPNGTKPTLKNLFNSSADAVMRYRNISALLLSLCLLISCSDEKTIPVSPDALHAPPVLLSPAFGTVVGHPVTLTWKSEFTYASFRIQIDTVGEFATPVLDQTVEDAFSFELADYPQNKVLYWRVGGVEEGIVRWSAQREFTTRLHEEAPILISPADESVLSSEIELRWEEHPRSQQFTLRLSGTADFTSMVLDTMVNGLVTVTVNDLVGNTDYYWKVGVHIQDTVFWSAVWSFSCDIPPPEGYRSCTITFDGISMLVERHTHAWQVDEKDTTTISLDQFESTFPRSRSQGMRFEQENRTQFVTEQVNLTWSSLSQVQELRYNRVFNHVEYSPQNNLILSDHREMEFTLAPMSGNAGVYEISGSGPVEALFLTFEYSAEFYEFESVTTRLLEMQFAPDASVRLTFE